MMSLLFSLLFSLSATPSLAAVDIPACIARLELETAENEMVVREERGEDVGQLTCKLRVRKIRNGDADGPCEKILKFSYTCSPGKIHGSGGACCPG